MPTSESVIALMRAVAMEKESTIYAYSVFAFRDIEELKRKEIPSSNIVALRYTILEEGIKTTHFLGHYRYLTIC